MTGSTVSGMPVEALRQQQHSKRKQIREDRESEITKRDTKPFEGHNTYGVNGTEAIENDAGKRNEGSSTSQ